ncbi:MAG TPA: RNA polymerase sigma factor [Terriglobia bacterium]|nr:RNA polymerase sigma factor [Terriglobia bacterium]
MDQGENMLARAITLARGGAARAKAEVQSLAMDEESFRIVYERTARPLWAYLARVSGNPALADDLLQECYCRFLALANPPEEEAHRKNYLFRIATNLLRDHWRATRRHGETSIETADVPSEDHDVANVPLRSDLGQALSKLKPKERQLLWLAYAEGASHREIARTSGMKEASVRPLLFRARKKLLALIRGATLEPGKA